MRAVRDNVSLASNVGPRRAPVIRSCRRKPGAIKNMNHEEHEDHHELGVSFVFFVSFVVQ
jgi:hypothetical protein